MTYYVEYSKEAVEMLKTLDRYTLKFVVNWIEKNLHITNNPWKSGKKLNGKLTGYLCYKIRNLCIIAEMKDNKLIITHIETKNNNRNYSIV